MIPSNAARAADTPGVIAPPPLIFAAILTLSVAVDWALGGSDGLLPDLHRLAGLAMLAPAAMLLVGALGLFRRARTRPEPWQPTSAIVTTGVYAVTRNPMYVGMALAFAGLACVVDRPLALFGLPVALLLVHHGVILREERYLERKFGDPYRRYAARVRRWL